MSLFLRSGFSRVPVVGEGLDDVRGILYLKDVARRLHEDAVRGPREVVDAVLREAHFVPDSKPADDLLRDMQRSANHVAIVVDEYGGTAGMVTLEDLVEEIVGEIADEYDHEEPDVEKLGDDLFRVPSRLHVEDLGELFGLELEDEEVDTVGGLLAKALGRVPIAGASARGGRPRAHSGAVRGPAQPARDRPRPPGRGTGRGRRSPPSRTRWPRRRARSRSARASPVWWAAPTPASRR